MSGEVGVGDGPPDDLDEGRGPSGRGRPEVLDPVRLGPRRSQAVDGNPQRLDRQVVEASGDAGQASAGVAHADGEPGSGGGVLVETAVGIEHRGQMRAVDEAVIDRAPE
ncbi:MAG: hypothetical protein ABJA16_01595 [Nakamurella sp.]